MVGLSYTRSRRSFLFSYLFAIFISIVLFYLYTMEIFSGFVIYLLSFPVFYLILEPEYQIMSSRYFLKDESVEGEFGILIKKRIIIPWKLVSRVSMRKDILGRILNYGDIVISTIGQDKSDLVMRGLKNPEKILNEIEERVGSSKIIF